MKRNLKQIVKRFNRDLKSGRIIEGKDCWETSEEILNKIEGVRYWIPKVGHFYVVPLNANPESLALNQADKGFNQYPAFTVSEVQKLGHDYFG